MTVTLPARLAYLTETTPGRVTLTLHTEQAVAQAILTNAQLANLVADGARFMRPLVEAKS